MMMQSTMSNVENDVLFIRMLINSSTLILTVQAHSEMRSRAGKSPLIKSIR
jgi:hypothetical protein